MKVVVFWLIGRLLAGICPSDSFVFRGRKITS